MWIWKLCLNYVIDLVVDISADQVKIWTRKGLEGNSMWIWACVKGVSLVVSCQHEHFYSIAHDGGTRLANKRILESKNFVNNNSKSQKPRVSHSQTFYFPWYLQLHETSQSDFCFEKMSFLCDICFRWSVNSHILDIVSVNG